jgi:hypothetical protein
VVNLVDPVVAAVEHLVLLLEQVIFLHQVHRLHLFRVILVVLVLLVVEVIEKLVEAVVELVLPEQLVLLIQQME